MEDEISSGVALSETMPDERGAALFLPAVDRDSFTVHVPEQLPALLGMVRIFAW